jgi:hypothetical protein
MLRRRDGLLAIAAVLDGHGLHRMVDDADRAVVNAGRDANKITRSCALSFVVGFSMVYSRRQLWAKARGSHSWPTSGLSSAVVWATHGRVVLIAAAALRGLGNSPKL